MKHTACSWSLRRSLLNLIRLIEQCSELVIEKRSMPRRLPLSATIADDGGGYTLNMAVSRARAFSPSPASHLCNVEWQGQCSSGCTIPRTEALRLIVGDEI